MSLSTIARRVLNLPDAPAQQEHAPAGSSAPVERSWADVMSAPPAATDERLQPSSTEHKAKDVVPGSDSRSGVDGAHARRRPAIEAPWTQVEETQRGSWARKAGRGLLFTLIAVLLLMGVRDLLFGRPGSSQASKQGTVTGSALPTGQAQAVAARWASSYLTWDGDTDTDDAARSAALAKDTQSGVDLSDSWNGHGAQHVAQVLPAQVSVSGRAGSVTVYAQIVEGPAAAATPSTSSSPTSSTTKAPASKKPAPKKSTASKKKAAMPLDATATAQPVAAVSSASSTTTTSWISLSVPVAWDGHRVVVSGLPAFVGTPAPGSGDTKDAPASDDKLTAATQGNAQAFFAAYAGTNADAMQAATAPGVQITPLGGAVQFVSLDQWTVYATEDNTSGSTATTDTKTRHAQAVVRWDVSGGQVTQVYDVTLAALTGAGSSTWRVAAVTASTYPVSQ